MPKISYLVSAYNAERYIERRLRNLLCEQTEQDVEVIVVDSASEQNEKEIVEKWQCLFPDKVKYIRQPERTPYGVSWLLGAQNASSIFCTNANCDDLIYSNFTEKVYNNFIKADPRIVFIYTGIHVVNEKGESIGMGCRPPFDRELMTYECHTGPCVTFRRDIPELDWDLMYKMAYEYTSAFDYALWLYMMSLGYYGFAIPDILTIYTQRSDSIENSDKWRNNYETYSAISRFFGYNFDSHLKHAKEFRDFNNLPPKQEWIDCMRSGKKWR